MVNAFTIKFDHNDTNKKMIEYLFYLFLYHDSMALYSGSYCSGDLPTLSYGYKKNAQVQITLSNLSSQTVFGLATQKELKKIQSLDSCFQYCNGKEHVFGLQHYFEINESFNFLIPSKSVLTPVFITCAYFLRTGISIKIQNGKNSLDYRYQNSMTFHIVFSTIFFIITIGYFIFYIFIITHSHSRYQIILLIYYLLIAIETLMPAIFFFTKYQ